MLVALLLLAALQMQEKPREDERVGLVRPRAISTRTAHAPTIDGRLDDDAWAAAVPIGGLTQIEPDLGQPCSERTDIRFLHDDDYLYMAIRCYDENPAGIVSTTSERDAFLDVDDRVEIVFDTFLDRRNAFFFQINAAGSKGDALVSNNGNDFNKPWDGIWDAAARVDGEGWSAELALPFKTLNFDPGTDTWGFNVQRYIGRKREEARWASPSRDHGVFNIYRAGDLEGLTGIQQGIGLDVVPFFVSHWRNEREDGDKTLLGEPGFDLFYKIIPSLTLSATVNTDFAETEVDERQINLTRFPLFFPERRDFFLQDSGVFRFGLDSSLIPFFSRRIGLSPGGEEVPILAGAKLTGRAGDYGIGVMDVQTDDLDELDGQNLFVGRLTRDVGSQSTIGGIVTRGDPEGVADNLVYGVDGTFRADIHGDGRDLVARGFLLQSDTEEVSPGDPDFDPDAPAGAATAFGGSVGVRGDLWSWNASAMEIPDDFNAALGFVPRTDVRRYAGSLAWEPRPTAASIRQLEFQLDSVVFTDTDGELETWDTEVQPFGIELESGEFAFLEFTHTRDEPTEDFSIVGITVPAGEYDFTRGSIEVGTAQQRELSAAAAFETGDFYDGDRTRYSFSLLWQPGAFFNGQAAYELNDGTLENGDFETQQALVRANFSFSPELSWNNLLQWDTESDTIGVQSRLRWIPRPEQEVFLVFNETIESDSSMTVPQFQQLSFKITYAFRF